MNKTNLRAQVLSSPIHFLAFGLGSGLSPIAPGTMGTLAAIPFFLLIQSLSLVAYLLMLLVVCLFGVWLCGVSARQLGLQDPGGIVWDEFAGFLITMTLAPEGWEWVVIGFVLFRLFDIWKPWPINWVDSKVKDGLGIMLDDMIAGVYAFIVLQITAYFWK